MSDTLQVGVITAILTIMCGFLGWIANTLAGLRKDLNKKVDKYDCDRSMDRHCLRLDTLEDDVKKNTADIATIKGSLGV